MDHMKILKRAWQITRRYRALWWIGLLLVLAGGGLGSGFRGSVPAGSGSEWRTGPSEWEWPFGEVPEVPEWPQLREVVAPAVPVIIGVIVALAVLAVLLGLVSAVVRLVTRVSLIEMVHRYEETGEQVGFGAGLRLGWSRSAWRLFLLNLILALPMLLVLLVLAGLGLLAFLAFSAGDPAAVLGVVIILAALLVMLLAVVFGIVLGPIRELASRVLVIESLGPWAALKSALSLVRRHLGPAALQWLILVGVRIAWGIVMIPVNVVLAALAFLAGGIPGLIVGGIAAWAGDVPLGVILGVLVFVPIFIVVIAVPNLALNALAIVYQSTTWTLSYRELLALDDGDSSPDSGDGDAEPESDEEEAT